MAGDAAAFAELPDDTVRVHSPDHAITLGARHQLAAWHTRIA